MKTLILMLLTLTMACATTDTDNGYCPEPEISSEPLTCQFYQGHAEVVPNLLCHIADPFHDPVLTSGHEPVLHDRIGIWVPAMRRLDDNGQTCGEVYGVIQSQQYRVGWDPSMPDCYWTECSEFAEISPTPNGD